MIYIWGRIERDFRLSLHKRELTMKLHTFFIFGILFIQFFCFSCRKQENRLTTSMFVYPDKVRKTIQPAASSEPRLSLESETTLIKTSLFNLTTGYLIPFLYFEMGWKEKVPASIKPAELDRQIRFLAEREVYKELLYHKSIEENIRVTPEEIKNRLEQEKNQNTIPAAPPFTEEFRLHLIKRELMLEKLFIKLQNSITINDEEIISYYTANPHLSYTPKRVVARQIFMKKSKDPLDDKTVGIKMESIRKRALGGENFIKLVRLYSEDKASQLMDGRLGEYLEEGSAYKDFEDIVFAYPEGALTPVFETIHGHYLVKIEKIMEPRPREIAEVKDFIMFALAEEKMHMRINALKEELAKKYKMQVLF